ncbi:CU044_5270 family protein [Micromonospora sp. WMMD812]|uniref:CU044_5270 family protein n=1 Tax=Micromonospora sp. WMMD812 TaxID=3015152 RepID=UPI00248C6DC3|nr:CU044_5270 family protein [Micromonospora sp. WMMD812]WBB65672.1 CU044_5270 family protein [Micromonospora sp. WMMD812]
MFGEQRTRTLLGPTDPARGTVVAPPRLSARELIDRAEATPDPATAHPVAGRRHRRPSRRLVLAAGALAVAAGASAVVRGLDPSTPDAPPTAVPPGGESGVVLVPVAYQFDSDAPAGAQLRALAGRIADAEHDQRRGRYMYHRTRVWGDPVMTSEDGRHHMAFADETRVWQTPDGKSGEEVTVQLEPQYPDQASRDYWQRSLRNTGTPAPARVPLPPMDIEPLPSTRAQVGELLKVEYGAGVVSKEVSTVFGRYVVPRRTRAEILRVLADVPGFVWRGEVTDRAGRKGVAITFDDRAHDAQSLLIFDPRTGELLAHERLSLAPMRISAYLSILDTAWTDQPG